MRPVCVCEDTELLGQAMCVCVRACLHVCVYRHVCVRVGSIYHLIAEGL